PSAARNSAAPPRRTNTSSTWPWRTSTTAAPRREARKPTASVSASTKPSCRNSIRWRSANASTVVSSSCRPTSMPGSPGTTNSDHIRGAGATARRQCKPSLTPSHSPGRNRWPPDVGQTQPFRHQTGQLSDQVSASTDYIVVGAGSAGAAVANRLSADPRNKVLLLEAGRASHPWSFIPIGMAKLITNPAANWLYSSEPEVSTNGRRLPVPRGKLLGGSSSINGMVFVRGQAQDFDTWAQMGNRGWSYTEVVPFFKRMEGYAGEGDDALRG